MKQFTQTIRSLPSFAIAFIMLAPVVCVFIFAFGVDVSVWQRLWERRIPDLFVSSTLLVVSVTFFTSVLGGTLAFLVERTDLPFRKILKPLLVTPLITPCYIIAICYVNFFGINGLGERLMEGLGCPLRLPNIYGFWGAAFVLSIGTYPYVYTIVSASLHTMDPRLSESARCLGVSKIQRFFRVHLPLLLPAFSAGGVLVTLYVLSDFGVVNMLRYSTFVNTIYEQISGRYDYSSAAALSTVLIALTVVFVMIQSALTRKRSYASIHTRTYNLPQYNLKLFKIPALALIFLVLLFGIILPVGILVYWFIQSLQLNAVSSTWSVSWPALFKSGFNSISISSLAATAAVLCAIPLTFWTVRKPDSIMGKVLFFLSQSGIALPGVLIALALSVIFSRIAPALNFSILALFLAFLIHFFAQALQTTQVGFRQVSAKFEECARTLGLSSFQSFWRVTRPLLTPTLMTAWVLVFLSSMRELPASLLLRPAGFDPLTVQIWNAASEGFYEQAAAPALLVVLLSLPLVFVIIKNQTKYSNSEGEGT